MYKVRIVIFLLLFLSLTFNTNAQKQDNDIYKADYIEACTLIAQNYIYLEPKLNVSREQFLADHLKHADEVNWNNNKTIFIKEMQNLRMLFPDGHFGIEFSNTVSPIRKGKFLGFTCSLSDYGNVYVGRIYPFFSSVLSKGDIILEWNDISIHTEIERLAELDPQSTDFASLEKAARLLTLDYPFYPLRSDYDPVKIKYLEKDSGKIRECTFIWADCSATTDWKNVSENEILVNPSGIPSLETLPTDSLWVNDRLVYYIRKLDDEVLAVLHLRSFNRWTLDDLDETFKRIIDESPTMLLIDLKDSAGGYFDQVLYLSHALNVDKPFQFSYDVINENTGFRSQGIDDFYEISSKIHLENIWKGRTYIRINPITKSAGDFFSRWMQLNQRAVFIGSPTAGAGGGTDEFILQNTKTSIYFPLRDRTIQSDAFGIEGYSVLPDFDESLESIKIIEMFENQ